MQLKSAAYYQNRRTVDAYIDEFEDLISLSKYSDPITTVIKFRCGLNTTTQDKIAESGSDRPADDKPEDWYKATRRFDQNWIANEAFHASSGRRHNLTPILDSTPRTTYQFPHMPTQPKTVPGFLSSTPSTRPTPVPYSTGIPMDVDGQRTQGIVPPRCYWCNSFDHLAPACPRRFNVRHMTHTERDDFATAILIDPYSP